MSGTRRRKAAPRSRRGRKPAATRDFWGNDTEHDEPTAITVADDPAAMVLSLGPPPISGPEETATALFTLVYDKAAMRAGAVARAFGLLATDEPDLGD
jgi:hypothetical protein